MALDATACAVLAHYPPVFRSEKPKYLAGAGGFSGAEFWRFSTPTGDFCLRRWPPEHPSEDRLRLIHAVLRHAARGGIDFVPLPFATVQGESFVRHQGCLWELTPWLPGSADFEAHPSTEKLEAAIAALSQFHSSVQDFPHPLVGVCRSPGVASRVETLRNLLSGDADQISLAVSRSPDRHPLKPDAELILRGFQDFASQINRELLAYSTHPVQLQPAIRDIWSQHVLFEDERVSGIVDFGTLNIETPAADVARLLGSMAADDAVAWEVGLRAYQANRPLSDVERRLVHVFDRSSVVLSGMNWLQWIFVEGRQFSNFSAVASRLRVTIARLAHLRDGQSPFRNMHLPHE